VPSGFRSRRWRAQPGAAKAGRASIGLLRARPRHRRVVRRDPDSLARICRWRRSRWRTGPGVCTLPFAMDVRDRVLLLDDDHPRWLRLVRTLRRAFVRWFTGNATPLAGAGDDFERFGSRPVGRGGCPAGVVLQRCLRYPADLGRGRWYAVGEQGRAFQRVLEVVPVSSAPGVFDPVTLLSRPARKTGLPVAVAGGCR